MANLQEYDTNKADLLILDSSTPWNIQLQGIFKRSFAYYTLKERIPIILTKVIDGLSKKGQTAPIAAIAKLKSDLVTNKKLELLEENSKEAKKWNEAIAATSEPTFFTAVWVFSECYIYRRLKQCFDGHMNDFDPFREQKDEAFTQNIEGSCVVARKLQQFISSDINKDSLQNLLKLSLWGNRCDLSLTVGASAETVLDPVEMLNTLTPNLLADDTGKIVDFILERTKQQENLIFDIICDNAGYELVTDLCIGHFLLAKGLVKKIRYHVKAIPWFVSDVTPRDFQWVVDQCASVEYTKQLTGKQGEHGSNHASDGPSLDGDPAKVVTSKDLQTMGKAFRQYLKEGSVVVEVEDFWTSPHVYKDMKRQDENLYKKLQSGVMCLFKGDLNYRKLLGEMNWNPTTPFETSLQGFHPSPVVAIRTVKADLIAGLPAGKWEELNRLDDKWMEKGDYGVIQFCTKTEEL